MRNPLKKRIFRELAADWPKYLVIIIFMVLMIGVISGMYVGHDSMLAAIEAGQEELNLEDGSFELKKKASEEMLDDIAKGEKADVYEYFIEKGNKEADKKVNEELEKGLKSTYGEDIDEDTLNAIKESDEYQDTLKEALEEAHETVSEKVDEKWDDIADEYELNEDYEAIPVTIYEHFYKNETEDKDNDGESDATVRVFKSDSSIDMASFNEGRAPENEDEIAIDRMHADNVGLEIGDTVTIGNKEFKIVGLLSYVNYLTLHESNTDFMFDAFGFDVAMVTPEAFDTLSSRIHYEYAYTYNTNPSDKIEEADYAENMLKCLITQALVYDNEIEDYLPEYLRQASNFAPSDIEGDSTGTSILCYILIGVIAFIFAITISNTIYKEASVIGTLRASGYSKRELIVHYMSMPIIVTIIGAVIGNVLGYTAFKDVAVNLYYESYSLPTCYPVWSNTAIVKTTVIPLILMFFINLIVIAKKLRLSPLRFLRHDLTTIKRTKAMRIPRWSFLGRFRCRIVLQNIPNYAVLIFGVVFIELMLCFAFGLPDSLKHYAKEAPEMMFSEYQYILMGSEDSDGNVIATAEITAEKFKMKTLLYAKYTDAVFEGRGSGGDESVSVYGIYPDSDYIDIDENTDGVYISSAFEKKFDRSEGDTITLNEEYENKSYEVNVDGVVDYDGGIAVFMNADDYNEMFDVDEKEFTGYFSKNEITDIDEEYIATIITSEDIIKVTVQLMHSMGGFAEVFKHALIVLSAALIYLLAKIIIEKNEHAISMTKILGFKDGEIAALYILPTAIVITIFTVVAFVAGYYLMVWIFKIFILQMDGYFAFYLSKGSMILSMLYLLIGYMFVSVIDYIRIKRISPNIALKNVE